MSWLLGVFATVALVAAGTAAGPEMFSLPRPDRVSLRGAAPAQAELEGVVVCVDPGTLTIGGISLGMTREQVMANSGDDFSGPRYEAWRLSNGAVVVFKHDLVVKVSGSEVRENGQPLTDLKARGFTLSYILGCNSYHRYVREDIELGMVQLSPGAIEYSFLPATGN
jgi:hypothetical protein